MYSLNRIFFVLNEVEKNNNTNELSNADLLKSRHKNAWSELNEMVHRIVKILGKDVFVKSSRWNTGQYLYRQFWFELKREDRKDSSTSVSLSFTKNNLKIYLEWDRKNADKSSNTLEEHNNWLNYLHEWINESDIELDKYFVWITNDEDKDKPQPIKLRSFLNNEVEYNKQIQQQQRNSTYPIRIGQILSKEEIAQINTFEHYLLSPLKDLFNIYDNTISIIDFPSLEPSNRSREFNIYSTYLKDRIVFEYLFNGMSHRWLDEHLIGIDSEMRTGHESMNILHYIGLKGKHKGIFKNFTIEDAINSFSQQKQEYDMVIDCLNRLFSNENIKNEEKSSNEHFKITETEKEQIIKSRIGQMEFKNSLLSYETKCRLCGVMDERFLIASHIKPWSKSNNVERLDSDNGLLLCPNHDALFDKGYISFDNTGAILISSRIDENLKLFLNIHANLRIYMNDSQKTYMEWHRENIFI